MDVNLLNSVATSAGTMLFPCMFCILVFKTMMEYVKEKDKSHTSEIDKLSEVIHQNTETLIALKACIESIGTKEKENE